MNKLDDFDSRLQLIEDRQDYHEEVNATVLNELDSNVEHVMEKTMEEFVRKISDKADTNKDGSTTPIEWVAYLLKNPVFIVAGLLILILREIPEFILMGINSGIWDWGQLINSIFSGALLFVWYIFTNANNKQYTSVLDNVKEEYSEIIHSKDEIIKKKDEKIDEITDKYLVLQSKQGLLEYELETLKKRS